MTKIKLGNDFNDENAPDKAPIEESAEKTSDEESEDEKENSADTDDSKNQEEETGKESDIDKESGGDIKEEEKEEVEEKEEPKEKELQGLLDAEKGLDTDNTDIDTAISAAKQRISQKRGERREKRDLVDTIDSKFPDNKAEDLDDLSDIDPETLKVLDRFTKAKGLVPKSEIAKMTYQDRHNNAQDSFYAAHPEYLPENDTNDILYKALKKELTFYAAPTDAKLIPTLFAKAHDAVVKQYPDKFKGKKSDAGNDNQINKSVRIKTQGLGGKSSAGGTGGNKNDSTKKTFSDSQIRALEDGGWSQEEIKTLTS